ncbi:MAG: hypothetical protein ACOCYQ_08725 [Alkalispirochaeta sp.]
MSRRRVVPTVLVGRRAVIIWAMFVVAVLVHVFVAMVRSYPLVPTGAARSIESAAALTAVLVVFIVTTVMAAVRRNRRLESELRRYRGGGTNEVNQDTTWSTLGDAIRGYNQELQRSRVIRSARIQAQRDLIRTIMHGIKDRRLYVLSGSGDILFQSAAVTATADEKENDSGGETQFDPPGAAMAAHLLAGKGSGTVRVDGVEMHFTGVFGRTVATTEATDTREIVLLPGLSYIVITEEPIAMVFRESTISEEIATNTRSVMRGVRRFLDGIR